MGKFEPDEYRHESNAVSLLNYHFVFIPKRRRKVLVGEIATRLQAIIFEVCDENRCQIVALEIMPDHVHMFINAKPTDSPAQMIQRVKGRASITLKKGIPLPLETSLLVDSKLLCLNCWQCFYGDC